MKNRGYTLLFAVLTAAMVLGVAVFVVNIARKQFLLATTARESMYALYAAESGIECAALAGNGVGGGSLATSTPQPSIPCAGNANNFGYSTVSAGSVDSSLGFYGSGIVYVSSSPISIALQNGTCVQLMVYVGPINSSNDSQTVVDARGYNVCKVIASVLGPAESPQTVERGLRLRRQ